MWLTSKIKQVIMVLKPGVVTLGYPFEASVVPEGFRGLPLWDHRKCVGCGGCSNHCPARTILVRDVCQELRIMLYDSSRCTYCGRCAEVCPEEAIKMSDRFENATNDKADNTQRMELFMLTCQRCGRCYDMETTNAIDKLDLNGYRYDNLEARALIRKTTDQFDIEFLKETEKYKRPSKLGE